MAPRKGAILALLKAYWEGNHRHEVQGRLQRRVTRSPLPAEMSLKFQSLSY